MKIPMPDMPTDVERIRGVIVWDSCPADPVGLAPAPATDIDLFLVKDNQIVLGSQSVMDSTEGFDLTITPEEFGEGEYELWWAAAPASGACGGVEDISFAFVYWVP
jgi:hypothetical protein